MDKGTIVSTTPPPAPTELTGTYAQGRMTLNWNAEADIESGVKTFIIYRNGSLMQIIRYANRSMYSSTMGYQRWNDGDYPTPFPPQAMTFDDTDVNDAGTYTYQVATVNWSDVTGAKPRAHAATGKSDRDQVRTP